MDSELMEFVLTKVKEFAILSIFIAIIIIVFFGFRMGLDYYCGFFIGVLNFIGLSIGSDINISRGTGSNKSKSMGQSFFFLFRYIAVAGSLVLLIKYQSANVFALIIGFLTIHIALLKPIIPILNKKRKEG